MDPYKDQVLHICLDATESRRPIVYERTVVGNEDKVTAVMITFMGSGNLAIKLEAESKYLVIPRSIRKKYPALKDFFEIFDYALFPVLPSDELNDNTSLDDIYKLYADKLSTRTQEDIVLDENWIDDEIGFLSRFDEDDESSKSSTCAPLETTQVEVENNVVENTPSKKRKMK